MSETSERRRHPRIPARLPVRVSTLEPERDSWTGKPFFRASTEVCANVSRGGAFVRTSEPLSPGQRLLLEVRLPDGAQLDAIGRVAWCRRIIPSDGESGVGVEFLGGAPEHFTALESFITQLGEPA